MVEVIQIGWRMYVAGLFDNISPGSQPVWELVRSTVGNTEAQAVGNLNVPRSVTVVTHVGDSNLIWESRHV